MANLSVTASSNANLIGMMFGSSSNKSNLDGLSDMYSVLSASTSDYNLIKSGSYRKLLKAYYTKTDEGQRAQSSHKLPSKENDTTTALLEAKSSAEKVTKSLDKLSNKTLYKSTGRAEDGTAKYDKDKIAGAVKEFVNSYNSFLDSTDDLNSPNVLKKTLNAVKATAKNENMLADIGITIGADNKLSLDEDKLKNANVSKVSSLFSGAGSYGSTVSNYAKESYRISNSTVYTNTHASSYSSKGSYSMLGQSNYINSYL